MNMKKIYIIALAAGFALQATAQKKLPESANEQWLSQVSKSLNQLNYPVQTLENNFAFEWLNPVQNTKTSIGSSGYFIQGLSKNHQEQLWDISFGFNSYGRNNNSIKFDESNNNIVKEIGKINFSSGPLTVEYINNEQGLRQNFILQEKPEGQGNLVVSLHISTALEVSTDHSGQLRFHPAGNNTDLKMIYDGLAVYDSRHQPVPAYMEFDNTTHILNLVVNDGHAMYPLTIDPLNHVPEWSTSADGILPALLNNLQLQVQTLYGYTVAGLGDINGDGYDDVSVSAPGMADVVTGTGSLTGVGAVFIYLGSVNGLSVTPIKYFNPTQL
ncbi:MAG: hypothetical protein IPP73_13005 [Chitinophagaceae bacterium]|nr:hypothetical protein [Chitinophagaceae bacterium]